MIHYYSLPTDDFQQEKRQLWQADPKPYRDTGRGKNRADWTTSVHDDYCVKAKKEARLMLENMELWGRPYPWEASINLEAELDPKQIQTWFKRIKRRSERAGLIAHWVAEVNRSNLVHLQLTGVNEWSLDTVEAVIRDALDKEKEVAKAKGLTPIPARVHVDWIDNAEAWCSYVFKAKVGGWDDDGHYVNDIYADKRILFVKETGLQKTGTIGHFWKVPKEQLWKTTVAEPTRKAVAGLTTEGLYRVVRAVDYLISHTVSSKVIEFAIGYWSQAPGIRAWNDELADGSRLYDENQDEETAIRCLVDRLKGKDCPVPEDLDIGTATICIREIATEAVQDVDRQADYQAPSDACSSPAVPEGWQDETATICIREIATQAVQVDPQEANQAGQDSSSADPQEANQGPAGVRLLSVLGKSQPKQFKTLTRFLKASGAAATSIPTRLPRHSFTDDTS